MLGKQKHELNGLVLVGGYSRRMGKDKSQLVYHGKAQRLVAYELLSRFCKKTYLSCRLDQQPTLEKQFPTLVDPVENIGPAAGLVGAFQHNPSTAWLVLACDMPWVLHPLVEQLIKNRDQKMAATAFVHPQSFEVEPLIAIWEPTALKALANNIARRDPSPRKTLEQLSCRLIRPDDSLALKSINTPEQYDKATDLLGF